MDRVELVPVLHEERQRVGLVELEREVGLLLVIDPDDLEAGAVVTHGATTRPTEQVEQSRSSSWTHERFSSCPVRRHPAPRGAEAGRSALRVERRSTVTAGTTGQRQRPLLVLALAE